MPKLDAPILSPITLEPTLATLETALREQRFDDVDTYLKEFDFEHALPDTVQSVIMLTSFFRPLLKERADFLRRAHKAAGAGPSP